MAGKIARAVKSWEGCISLLEGLERESIPSGSSTKDLGPTLLTLVSTPQRGRLAMRAADPHIDPFSDLDRVTYTKPSVYSTRQLATNLTCPFADCGTATSPSQPSGTASPAATSSQASNAGSRARIPSIFRPLDLIKSFMVWDLWTGIRAEVPGTSERQADPWQAVANQTSEGEEGGEGRHTNNWAVLVCTSRYWFNYRVSRLASYPKIR